jgi:hypothetical protein
MTRHAKLGTYASNLFSPPLWTDDYPAGRKWADELEKLLAFADSQGQIEKYLPRLHTNRNNQRDEALNELRVAFYLHRSGFPITTWEPAGNHGRVGEYTILSPESVYIFTEVKSRGWESELTQAERLAGRTQLPKYIDGDGGAYANWKGVRDCIAAAYDKFTDHEPNLLVIADDFFVSLIHSELQIRIALYINEAAYGEEVGYFTNSQYQNIGGVALFSTNTAGDAVAYDFRVFDNGSALNSTTLPPSLLRLCD